jgi:hypothetical protein
MSSSDALTSCFLGGLSGFGQLCPQLLQLSAENRLADVVNEHTYGFPIIFYELLLARIPGKCSAAGQ